AQVGDEVEFWGRSVAVDEVARHAQTISYELLCNAGSRSPKVYL
ncbi:MAG: alanine racemase C-terminal domain-containing protein, partial [Acidihalobacter sp.]